MDDKRRVKIGFVCKTNPANKQLASGSPYYAFKQFEKMGYDVIWIPYYTPWYALLYVKIVRLFFKLKKKDCYPEFTPWVGRQNAKTINQDIVDNVDVLFRYFGAPCMSGKKFDKPSIYFKDGLVHCLLDYYFLNLSDWSKRKADELEYKAVNNADTLVFSSDWCATDAIEHYQQPSEKVHVVEFGANINEQDIIPHNNEDFSTLHLVFLGVKWKRKGGDIAVETVQELNNRGVKTVLHIVGIRELDDDVKKRPYIDYVGYLSKDKEHDKQKLKDLFSISHAMLLPTIADCSPISFAEASANGLPVFTHHTGGIPNYIENGKNGYMLPIGSNGVDFAKVIQDCLQNKRFVYMSSECRRIYKEKLNWNVWGRKMSGIIDETLNNYHKK